MTTDRMDLSVRSYLATQKREENRNRTGGEWSVQLSTELSNAGQFDDSRSLLFHRHFHRGGFGFSTSPAGSCLDVASVLPAAQARPSQERDLRMWHRIRGRRTCPVPIAVLSLLHHFPSLRRGSG